MKLFCLLELVFILRIQFWMARSQEFGSLETVFPVLLLFYTVFWKLQPDAVGEPKVPCIALMPKSQRHCQGVEGYPSSKHKNKGHKTWRYLDYCLSPPRMSFFKAKT